MTQGVAFAMGLHVIAMIAGAGLLVLALRGGGADERLDRGADGPGGPPPPPPAPRPRSGPPLPDARPARVRLRGPGRLARLLPRPVRRRSHPPKPVPERARPSHRPLPKEIEHRP